MSKQLIDVPSKDVYKFMQKSIDRDQMILNHMLTIEKNVEGKFTEMSAMVRRVEDSVTLNDVECYDLKAEVFRKSTELTKDRYQEEDGRFTKVVGTHRRLIWKKLKEKFRTARYTHIRRIDFDKAMEFVRSFRLEEHI